MKILALSSGYPPYHGGGYEIRVKQILDALSLRGHAIRVLTNRPDGPPQQKSEWASYPVVRKLHNHEAVSSFFQELAIDLQDTRLLADQLNAFDPDVVYLGHIYILSKALLPYLASTPYPLFLDEGGASLKGAWTDHGRWFRLTSGYGEDNWLIRTLKPLLVHAVTTLSHGCISTEWRWPEYLHVMINSYHNLENLLSLGVPMQDAVVLHSGLPLWAFPFRPRTELGSSLVILCPGRVEPRKGTRDAIRLLQALRDEGISARLQVVGSVASPAYLQEVQALIAGANLEDQVEWHSRQPQGKLAELYQQADLTFFPSYQEIGFSRVPLEAMASGSLVISYGNESSNELIRNGENGWLIPTGDFEAALRIIKQLQADPTLVHHVTAQARQDIEKDFDFEGYVDGIEGMLKQIISSAH